MEEFVIKELGNRYNQITGGSFDPDLNKRVFALTGGEFNVLQLFQKVFGYRGIPYGVASTGVQRNFVDDDNLQADIFTQKVADIQSILGTPIHLPVKFRWKPDIKSPIKEYLLPNEPLVTISGKKTIVRTPVAGFTQKQKERRGSVKELIAMDDYTIKIQGFMVNMESDSLPETDIRALREVYEFSQSVYIVNTFLTYFKIEQMAIESVIFPAVEGYQAIQGYEITGYHDEPYLLERI